MARCRVDKSIERVEVEGFAFPLGAYPIEEMTPCQGYTLAFEPADGSEEEGEWEEWPDRYVYDVTITATRLEPFCRALFAMLPGRVYPILDVLGHDEYREVDPYVSYELVGQERFLDAVRRYRAFFFEDGLVGFGAMSEEPFIYVFVDEHKIITVRAETALKERVESVLHAFDLEEVEQIAGADAATHEHRGVLDAPDDRPDLLTAEEIVEELREDWSLVLNVDAESNVDDEDNELGVTGWRCVVRQEPLAEEDTEGNGPGGKAVQPAPVEEGDKPMTRYAEVLLTADSLNAAEQLALEAVAGLVESTESEQWQDTVTALDRLRPDSFLEALGYAPPSEKPASEPRPAASAAEAPAADTPDLSEPKVWQARWME